MCVCVQYTCLCFCVYSVGGLRPQIRIVPVQLSRQQQGEAGGGEERLRALREQEEAARRASEENHRKAELRRALGTIQPPMVYTCTTVLLYIACCMSPNLSLFSSSPPPYSVLS